MKCFTGEPALAPSGSSTLISWPVSTFLVLPSDVKLPEKPDTNFLPLRELSVASMIAVKRPMTSGTAVKTMRSDVMLGPLKHVFSTHSSWSFHVDGAKKSSTHMSTSMAAKRSGSASSVNPMTRKSRPTLISVTMMPDSATSARESVRVPVWPKCWCV